MLKSEINSCYQGRVGRPSYIRICRRSGRLQVRSRYYSFSFQISVGWVLFSNRILEAGDDYYDYYGDTIESKIKALSDLESLIENEGPFDGVISFSHGGVLAATYLLREAMLQPTKHAQDPTFKLAIFFSSAQAVDPVLLKDHGIQKFMTSKDGEVIRIPTAHIWGKNDDEWKAASEEVASICITEKKLTFVHDGGHEVPGSKDRSALYKAVHVIRRTIHSAQVAC